MNILHLPLSTFYELFHSSHDGSLLCYSLLTKDFILLFMNQYFKNYFNDYRNEFVK